MNDASITNVRAAIERVERDEYYPNDSHVLADFARAMLLTMTAEPTEVAA